MHFDLHVFHGPGRPLGGGWGLWLELTGSSVLTPFWDKHLLQSDRRYKFLCPFLTDGLRSGAVESWGRQLGAWKSVSR